MAKRKASGDLCPTPRRESVVSPAPSTEQLHAVARLDKTEDKHATTYNPSASRWTSLLKRVQSLEEDSVVIEGLHLGEQPFRIGVPHGFKVRCEGMGKGKLEVTCKPKEAAKIDVNTPEAHVYQCRIVPKLLGTHEVSVEYGGKHIFGSPFQVTFNPPADASKCKMVETLPECSEGIPKNDMLFCFSTRGAEEGILSASVKPASSRKQYLPVDISVGGSEDHFHVQFTPTEKLKYTLAVKYDRQHIRGSPFTIALSDASMCKAEGKGLSLAFAGRESKFLVHTQQAGSGNLNVEVKGEGKIIEPDISCIQDELHEVSYKPGKPGSYAVSVEYGNVPIPGSPFAVACLEPPDAKKCVVSGPYLPSKVGKPVEMRVGTSNAGSGELAVKAMGDTSGSSKVKVVKFEDQFHNIVFNPQTPDIYTLSVTWGGDAIPGSPFKLNLSLPKPSEVTIAEPPSSLLKAGLATKICFDCSKAGIGEMTASCRGRSVGDVPVVVSKRPGVALYDLETTPPEEDIYAIHVQWAGIDIKGSPFSINLTVIDVTKIESSGPRQLHGREGPVEFAMSTKGAGLGKVVPRAIGSQAGAVHVAIKKTSDDSYQLSFQPPKPDIYTFSVMYGGERIPGSPYYVNTNVPSPGSVKVSGPTDLALSCPVVYKCNTIDAGAGELTALCQGDECGPVDLDVSKHGIAQVVVAFTPQQPDIYNLSIRWAGEHVPGSPFRINLLPIDVTKLQIGELQVPELAGGGEGCYVSVDCSRSGPGDITGQCRGEKLGEIPVDVPNHKGPKFKVSFQPNEPDIYHLSVFFAGQHIAGSPFTINLLPPQPKKVKHIDTLIPDDDHPSDPVSISFDVSQAGRGNLRAMASGQSAGPVPVEIEQVAQGQVKVLLMVPEPDIYTVQVFWEREGVPQSPFIISTKPPDVTKVTTQGPTFLPATGKVELSLQAQDAGRGKVKAMVIGSQAGQVPVIVSETTKDCYKLVFHPPQPDVYTFGVWYGREKVPDSPFYVNTHPPNAGNVRVTEPEIIQCLESTVYKCDASDAGSGFLVADCVGEESGNVVVEVQKHGAAKYHIYLVFPRPDVYKLSITWAGGDVPGSPSRINLLPVDASKVGVRVHIPGSAGAEERVCLDLDCSRTGLGNVEADCQGKSVGQTPVVIDPLEPDHYEVRFYPEECDIYTLFVDYSGTPIAGSPFTINLIPPNPQMLKLLRTSVPTVVGKDPLALVFDTSEAGRATLQSEASSGSTGLIPVQVKDLGDMQYKLHFIPPVPEVYHVVVYWASQPITGSPFKFDTRKPESVKCDGPSYSKAGEVAILSVNTAEAGPGKVSANCVGDKSGIVPTVVALSSPAVHSITIQPKREDIYKLAVFYDDTEVPGSPFLIDLHPHTLVDEEMTVFLRHSSEESFQFPEELQEIATCTVQAELLEATPPVSPSELTSYLGEPTILTVKPEKGHGELAATVVGEKSGPTDIQVMKNADGSSDVCFNPDTPDRYTISVNLDGEEIPGSPFVIVYILPVDPSKCRIVGLEDHPAISAVYQEIPFAVDTSKAGDSRLQVFLNGPSASGYPPNLAISSDKGIYDIVYLPTAGGVHLIHLLWGGRAIPGSPLVFEVATATALQTYEYGMPITIEVHHSSDVGEMKAYTIHQESGKKYEAKLSAVEEGSCKLKLELESPGVYAVHITISDKEIPGSPHFIEYERPPDPAAIRMLGLNSQGTVKTPLYFTVDTSEGGTGDLKVRLSGPKVKRGDFTVQDNSDGTYSAVLIPVTPGEYKLYISWSGKPINGSPFKVQVSEESVATVQPQLLSEVPPLGAMQVEIHPDDRGIFGRELPLENPACFRISVAKAGPGKLNIVTQGPGNASVRLDDNHDGTYVCELAPTIPGKYIASILWNDKHIPGSPYTLNFSSTLKSYVVEGLELESVKYFIGMPHKFRVQCGEGNLTVVCKPSNAALITLRSVSQLVQVSGSYTCEIVPVQVGNHRIFVLYENQNVLGSPFNVQFELPGSRDVRKQQIVSKSVEPTDCQGVYSAIFDVSTKAGGEGELSAIVEDSVTGEQVSASIRETSKGHHRIQATIEEGKEYQVSVKHGEQHIQGSPFRLAFDKPERNGISPNSTLPIAGQMDQGEDEVDTGPLKPEKVRAYGPGLENGFVGQEGNFTVETSEGGAGTLAVRVHGPRGAFKINMRHHPDSDRTILVRYDPNHVGQYTVDITWSDIHIPGSPFKVDILNQQDILRRAELQASEDDPDLDQLMPVSV